ncbi:hypothetical protein NCC78_30885, partial [Micromonospora phytophila]|uniref:hypothetical protein n=1 Tax=Micromonospora phytophila TaxID=709888 RepID=UPI00202FC4C6
MELRVHGVSGVGADRVLDRPDVEQVAGDRRGGFHRPRPGSSGPGGLTVEAYRWNDLPSGTAARTLSLVFLLPFMLGNLAVWMRPAGSGAGVKALCRLLALNLTLLYALTAAGVALDLVAWKCLGSSRCLAGRDWLAPLGGWSPGLRLAVLALVPVAAVALVWLPSARPPHSHGAFPAPAGGAGGDRLIAVSNWNTLPLVRRLRAIHVAAAFTALDIVLLAARAAAGLSALTVALLALAGTLLVACMALLCVPAVLERAPPGRGVDQATPAVGATAGGLTVATLGVVALDPVRWPTTAGLPGYAEIVGAMFLAQMTTLVALGALVLWRRGRDDRRPALLRGLGAVVVAALAVGLAGSLSAELVYRAAFVLNRGTVAMRPGQLAAPPTTYRWAILAFFLTAIVLVLVGGVIVLLGRAGRRRTAAAIVARDFPAPPPDAAAQLRHVEKAVVRASFTEQLAPVGVAYACLTLVGLVASVLGLMEVEPGPFAERNLGVPREAVVLVLTAGGWVIVGLVVALVVGGLFAYRTSTFRRYVGVLWDLGTFWPRAAHPFAPPSYAERAVPELARRICQLADRHDGVLLTGHSHGSVILAATVLQLPPQVLRRVALLTYGSPLTRLYSRLFPAYLGEDVLHELGDRVGWRWLNLWRDTDPIGGWIFCARRPGDPPGCAGPAG